MSDLINRIRADIDKDPYYKDIFANDGERFLASYLSVEIGGVVSKTKLPEGDGYNLVVQFKPTAEAKAQNFRFKLETHTCGECKRAEYAYICDE